MASFFELGFDVDEWNAEALVSNDVDVLALDDEEEEGLLFFLEPPPTGTFLREPPSVQYLRQVLQKYLGCVRL